MSSQRIHIQGGRVIDPANGIDAEMDIYIAKEKIVAVGSGPEGFQADQTIDASGQIVCPGLVDLGAHLREPGQEHKATIRSETRAAVAGGITTLCLPPDTSPVVETAADVELIRRRADDSDLARVLVIGALTVGLQGKELSEMMQLQRAGCVAMGNAHKPIRSSLVLRKALEYAGTFGITVFLQPEDPDLADEGCAHEGVVAARLGLPAIPEAAETVALARDLELIRQTGARAHLGRLSSARAVEMVAEARAAGLPISADVSAHQLHLTEMDIGDFDAQCHVRPPLRTQRDRDALRAGLANGILDAVCSDHQPHEPDAKMAPFPVTEPGISALETLLPLTLKMADEIGMPLIDALDLVTAAPAKILGIKAGTLSIGAPADICLFDPRAGGPSRRKPYIVVA